MIFEHVFWQFLSTNLPISLQETVVQRTSPKPIGRPRISTLNDTDIFCFETENTIRRRRVVFSPIDLSWFHNPESSLATNHMACRPTNLKIFGNRGQPIRGPFQWKGPLWYGVPIQLPSQGPSTISYAGQGGSLGSLGCVTLDSRTWSWQGMWQIYFRTCCACTCKDYVCKHSLRYFSNQIIVDRYQISSTRCDHSEKG